MEPPTRKPQPERDQTDASLQVERKKADKAIVEKLAETADTADALVERARDVADAVLGEARDREDRRRDPARTQRDATVAAVARGREVEDEIVRVERAAADEILRDEREEQLRTLHALLPLERQTTDRHLLTERARSDDALANRDDFLGIVTHDLRSLLSGIVLSANVLTKSGWTTDDELARTTASMERIQRYAARMNRLIGDLVDVTAIDTGRLELRSVDADAAALLAEAMDAFTPAAMSKGVTLVLEPPARALPAEFDHDRMLQVLANLVINAIKFTPAGGTITIRGASVDDEVRLAVVDTGCGIADDKREVVFERFWQLGKHDRRGLGLGLYISKCIVEAHGGRILDRERVGERQRLLLHDSSTSGFRDPLRNRG